MAWVFFQVFLAFGVGVAIVWWTWPKSPKPKTQKSEHIPPTDRNDSPESDAGSD